MMEAIHHDSTTTTNTNNRIDDARAN